MFRSTATILAFASLLASTQAFQMNLYSDSSCGNFIGSYTEPGAQLSCWDAPGDVYSVMCLDYTENDAGCSNIVPVGYPSGSCSDGTGNVGCLGNNYECIQTTNGEPAVAFNWFTDSDCPEGENSLKMKSKRAKVQLVADAVKA